jgi:hypothetical protein
MIINEITSFHFIVFLKRDVAFTISRYSSRNVALLSDKLGN